MSIRREIILNTFQELCFTNFGNGIDNISNLKAGNVERKRKFFRRIILRKIILMSVFMMRILMRIMHS
ncbi:MAG: hypothetical protein R2942_04065 [Ignavibacteria bacterium]